MYLDHYTKYLKFSFVKQRMYRRELETAYFTRRERAFSGILTKDTCARAEEYFAGLHDTLKDGPRFFTDAEPSGAESITGMADAILAGEYEFFDNRKISTGSVPQWNRDYLNEYEFPPRMGWQIDPHSVSVKAEAYIPLMLGRLYQLPALAMAYNVSGRQEYAARFTEIFESFVRENPTGAGIQWYKTSEAAIRVVNLIYGTAMIFPALRENSALLQSIVATILAHIEFIEHNPDLSPARDHHTFICALGLLLGGQLFSHHQYGKKLIAQAARAFEQEIRLQVAEDGVPYLQSMSAHLLLCEVLNIALFHGNRAGWHFTPEFHKRADALFRYLLILTQNSVALPNYGDAMPGYILSAGTVDSPLKAKHVLTFYSLLRERNEYQCGDCSASVWAYCHFPKRTAEQLKSDRAPAIPARTVRFAEGGHLLMQNDTLRIFVKGAAHGKAGRGAPGHSDVFSFEVFHRGIPVIVDPGTHAYYHDPVMRNMLRSVMYHNTVYVDNAHLLEYAGSQSKGTDISKPQILKWYTDNAEDIAEMQHFAYLRLADPVVFKRGFKFDKYTNLLEVNDTLLGGAEHVICSSLHLHPSVTVEKSDAATFLLHTAEAAFRVRFSGIKPGAELSIRDSWFSSKYYHLQPAKKIHYREQSILPASISLSIAVL